MPTSCATTLSYGLVNVPSRPKRAAAGVPYARAASVLDYASAADPATARALHEPHVALDAYGRVLSVSPAIAERLGFQASRMIGKRLRHRVPAADRAAFYGMLALVRDARLPVPQEVRMRGSDERVVTAMLAPLSLARAGTSVIIVLRVTFAPS